VVGAVIGAVVLAGCGAGQVSQTSRQVAAVDGANVTVGSIAVRDAQFVLGTDVKGAVAFPHGSSAPLQMTIVNTGGTPDVLVSASSPVASAVTISGTKDVPGGQTLMVEGTPVLPQATATPTATASAATPTASATPTATPAPTVAPDGSRTAQVVLTGLGADISSGKTYEVVLNFQKAGAVRLSVPVSTSVAPRQDEHAE